MRVLGHDCLCFCHTFNSLLWTSLNGFFLQLYFITHRRGINGVQRVFLVGKDQSQRGWLVKVVSGERDGTYEILSGLRMHQTPREPVIYCGWMFPNYTSAPISPLYSFALRIISMLINGLTKLCVIHPCLPPSAFLLDNLTHCSTFFIHAYLLSILTLPELSSHF